jgi:AbrB family looped-hinge helix DNA binding protein
LPGITSRPRSVPKPYRKFQKKKKAATNRCAAVCRGFHISADFSITSTAQVEDFLVYFFGVLAYTNDITSRILEIGGQNMNLARVSANGQITVPVEIRRALKLKEGDKILFYRKNDGEIAVSNASLVAVAEAQRAVAGSEYSEEDILAEVMRLRYGDKSQCGS